MPSIAVACSDSLNARIAAVNGEMQRGSTVAAMGIKRGIGRFGSADSVGGIMPSVAVAGSDSFVGAVAIMDSETQRGDAVASISVKRGVGG